MNATAQPQLEGWDIEETTAEPQEEEGYIETATLEELRSDLEDAHHALRKIVNINAASIGGPSNRHFGKKFIVAFGKAQEIARKELVAQIYRESDREPRAHEDDAGEKTQDFEAGEKSQDHEAGDKTQE